MPLSVSCHVWVLGFEYINTHQSLRCSLTQLFSYCRALTGLVNPWPSRLLFSLCSADSLFMTHRARRYISSQSKPKLFISQNIKYWFIFPSVPGAPGFCRRFIANNQCWQGTTSVIKDYTTVHIWADEDRPSLPLKLFSVSSSLHFSTFLQSNPEPFVTDSLCTICCVHMRFADGSLSTAEQRGDWSSQSGDRERSPVSEKCKFAAIQHPETQRDQDGNKSCYTAPTERNHRGQGG